MRNFKFVLYVAILGYVLFPNVTAVHAESINEQLIKTVLQSDTRIVPALETISGLKAQLSQGINEEELKTLAKTLLAQNDEPDISSLVTGAGLSQQLESSLKARLQQSLSDELSKYQINEPLQTSLASALGGGLTQETSLVQAPQNYKKVLSMTATAYAPGVLDNGHWNNLTYMGGTIHHGVAAVDPSIIPMGSKLWIEGYGEALAVDQGSAIKGNRIDLAFDNRQDALDYGIKNLKVYVIN